MPPEGRKHHVFSTPDTAPWINRGKNNLCNSREFGKQRPILRTSVGLILLILFSSRLFDPLSEEVNSLLTHRTFCGWLYLVPSKCVLLSKSRHFLGPPPISTRQIEPRGQRTCSPPGEENRSHFYLKLHCRTGFDLHSNLAEAPENEAKLSQITEFQGLLEETG